MWQAKQSALLVRHTKRNRKCLNRIIAVYIIQRWWSSPVLDIRQSSQQTSLTCSQLWDFDEQVTSIHLQRVTIQCRYLDAAMWPDLHCAIGTAWHDAAKLNMIRNTAQQRLTRKCFKATTADTKALVWNCVIIICQTAWMYNQRYTNMQTHTQSENIKHKYLIYTEVAR